MEAACNELIIQGLAQVAGLGAEPDRLEPSWSPAYLTYMLTVSLKDKTAASLSSYTSKPTTSTCAMMKEKDENRNPNVPAAERMRQYRARMKEDPSKLSEMREKGRIRKAASRKKCTDLTASERQARREIDDIFKFIFLNENV